MTRIHVFGPRPKGLFWDSARAQLSANGCTDAYYGSDSWPSEATYILVNISQDMPPLRDIRERYRDARVVVVAPYFRAVAESLGMPEKQAAAYCREAGIAYVEKPFTPEQLVDALGLQAR